MAPLSAYFFDPEWDLILGETHGSPLPATRERRAANPYHGQPAKGGGSMCSARILPERSRALKLFKWVPYWPRVLLL